MAVFHHDFAAGIGDWTEVALSSGHSTPVWTAPVSTDQLQATSTSSHNEALVWNEIDADGDRDDFDILCQVYVDSTSATQRYLGGRISTSGTRNGYALRVRTNSLDTYKFSGSTYTVVENGTFSVASGTWVWVRFRVNGTTVQAKAWTGAEGDEPGTWICSQTDTAYSTVGHVGCIKGANTNTQYWRYFNVGTNGDVATMPTGGSSWDASLTESASATDTATASFVINASASITESATGTDDASASYSASGAASIVESASATDTQTAAATVVASLLESASATDLATATLVAAVAIVEAASGTDNATGSFAAAGTVGVVETANATDTLSAAATLLAAIVEAGNATDAATAAATVVAMLTESAVATDQASAAAPGTWNVSVIELAAAVDVVAAYLEGAALAREPAALRIAGPGRPLALTLGAARRALGNILKPNS